MTIAIPLRRTSVDNHSAAIGIAHHLLHAVHLPEDLGMQMDSVDSGV